MSENEKMYVLPLRLYPSRFRKMYGDEAMQLFRDRARDQQGFIPKLRLWFDVLTDLFVSLPREYTKRRSLTRHPGGFAGTFL
jgi:hypothetical protein